MRGRELSTVAVVTGEPVRYCILYLQSSYLRLDIRVKYVDGSGSSIESYVAWIV